MSSVEDIISIINGNLKSITQHLEYSNKPGLYAFSLAKKSSLKEFGKSNQIIYIGKAEDSLRQRDLNTHFKDGRTGHSTLRRSIGAILKNELKAIAFSRYGTFDNPNIDNYKFDSKAEAKLSNWMKENLHIGYWEYDFTKENKPLHEIEEQLIIKLKPTLNLDKRTKRFNVCAELLTQLRQVCKDEARKNVLEGVGYY
jgi:hypothetical protein